MRSRQATPALSVVGPPPQQPCKTPIIMCPAVRLPLFLVQVHDYKLMATTWRSTAVKNEPAATPATPLWVLLITRPNVCTLPPPSV